MTGLIEEIQRNALDENVPIDSLLRRVKLAAGKLQLNDLDKWVDQELNGYSGELPPYRQVSGQVSAWNPYHGWIPVHIGHSELDDAISSAPIRESISSLQDLVDNKTGSPLHFPVPSGIVADLNKIMSGQTARMVVQLPRGHIVNILGTVRNMALDWAVKMEQQGVRGENLSFGKEEKNHARKAMTEINIGNIENFAGNLGSGNKSGDIHTDVQISKSVLELAEKLRAALPALQQEGVDGKKLEKQIKAAEAEAKSKKPNRESLAKRLASIRDILVGAAGSLTAEGAMTLIATVTRML